MSKNAPNESEAQLAHVRFDRREMVLHSDEHFDRVNFALHALKIVRPKNMTVAVHEGTLSVRVNEGRDLAAGHGARWGILSISPSASRAEIAVAVASLAGRDRDPYVLDLILSPVIPPV